ncbi:hypothetical protein XaC1_219 [Xanthomonas phage XaC1]|nr:hypothetical protein XaC1_219 [Xanthomonas phage XaC1]
MRLTVSDQIFLTEMMYFTVNARDMAKKSILTFNKNFYYHDNTVSGTKLNLESYSFENIICNGPTSDYIFFETAIVEKSNNPISKSLIIYDDQYIPENITFKFDNDKITCLRTVHTSEITEELIVLESSSDFFNVVMTNESTLTYDDLHFFKELFKQIEDPFELRYLPHEQYKYGWIDE